MALNMMKQDIELIVVLTWCGTDGFVMMTLSVQTCEPQNVYLLKVVSHGSTCRTPGGRGHFHLG